MRRARVWPLAALAAALAAEGVRAQDVDGGTHFSSLIESVPSLTPVTDYTGEFGSRSTMLGDLGGRRQALLGDGVALDATLTQVLQGVTSGGADSGNGGARYNGLLEYRATLDTGRLGMWSNGALSFAAQTAFGSPIADESGTISPVNYTSQFPVSGDNETELMEYYLTQGLSGGASLVIGRITDINFVDRSRFANDFRNQFLNLSMDNQLQFGGFLSSSTWAAILTGQLSPNVSLSVAAFDPNTQPGEYDEFGDDQGFAAIGQVKWELAGGLGGAASPIFIYANKEFNAFDNRHFFQDAVAGDPPTKTDNWMIHVGIDQYLWKPDKPVGAPNVRTAAFDFQEPGLGLFMRFGYSPEDRNAFNVTLQGGLGGRGLIPGRPYDRFGMGGFALFDSDEVEAEPVIGEELRDEYGFEAFYNFALTPWLQLTADFQYIRPGRENADDAIVLGTRLFARF